MKVNILKNSVENFSLPAKSFVNIIKSGYTIEEKDSGDNLIVTIYPPGKVGIPHVYHIRKRDNMIGQVVGGKFVEKESYQQFLRKLRNGEVPRYDFDDGKSFKVTLRNMSLNQSPIKDKPIDKSRMVNKDRSIMEIKSLSDRMINEEVTTVKDLISRTLKKKGVSDVAELSKEDRKILLSRMRSECTKAGMNFSENDLVSEVTTSEGTDPESEPIPASGEDPTEDSDTEATEVGEITKLDSEKSDNTPKVKRDEVDTEQDPVEVKEEKETKGTNFSDLKVGDISNLNGAPVEVTAIAEDGYVVKELTEMNYSNKSMKMKELSETSENFSIPSGWIPTADTWSEFGYTLWDNKLEVTRKGKSIILKGNDIKKFTDLYWEAYESDGSKGFSKSMKIEPGSTFIDPDSGVEMKVISNKEKGFLVVPQSGDQEGEQIGPFQSINEIRDSFQFSTSDSNEDEMAEETEIEMEDEMAEETEIEMEDKSEESKDFSYMDNYLPGSKVEPKPSHKEEDTDLSLMTAFSGSSDKKTKKKVSARIKVDYLDNYLK